MSSPILSKAAFGDAGIFIATTKKHTIAVRVTYIIQTRTEPRLFLVERWHASYRNGKIPKALKTHTSMRRENCKITDDKTTEFVYYCAVY
jgi:hypothetical protein